MSVACRLGSLALPSNRHRLDAQSSSTTDALLCYVFIDAQSSARAFETRGTAAGAGDRVVSSFFTAYGYLTNSCSKVRVTVACCLVALALPSERRLIDAHSKCVFDA